MEYSLPVEKEDPIENADVDYNVKLPEAEFDVMQAIWTCWNGGAPITTGDLMKTIGQLKGWKAPTLISFLVRLEKRGFIRSHKEGKERYYTPVADRATYINKVTKQFMEKYHDGSFIKLMSSIYKDKKFSNKEVDELLDWLRENYK